jgi:hypothetical protein
MEYGMKFSVVVISAHLPGKEPVNLWLYWYWTKGQTAFISVFARTPRKSATPTRK